MEEEGCMRGNEISSSVVFERQEKARGHCGASQLTISSMWSQGLS
jgi:hypothetical protein